MDILVSSTVAGYALDLIFGDPQWQWHPIRLIGRFIEKLEVKLNTGKINRVFAGVILVILAVGPTVFCIVGILKLSKLIHPIFYFIISALLIYFALSVKSLAVEAGKVGEAIGCGNIQEARKNLSMIVGRDTDELDEPEIIRATVETVAESAMDGVVAPLFYAFLGGPVLMWAYKAINTMDSMVGYRSERFIEFGKASAKLDGLVNLIPAKITCFFIGVSALCCGKDCLGSIKWGFRYFFKGKEKNSEATEAAMAGALGIQLGGLNFYDSIPVSKPPIGEAAHPLENRHIKESIHIAYLSSFLFLLMGICLFNSSRLIIYAKILFHNFCVFSGINSRI